MKPSKKKIYESLDTYNKLRGNVEKPLFSDRMFANNLLVKFIDAEELKKKIKKIEIFEVRQDLEQEGVEYPLIDKNDVLHEIDNLLKKKGEE